MKLLPNSKVAYKEHGGDPRNYRVDFTKVREVLEFEPAYSVPMGVKEIIEQVGNSFFKNLEGRENHFETTKFNSVILKTDLANSFVEAIREVLTPTNGFIPLHEPRVGELEKEYVSDCIESTFVSSVGKYVDRFEQEIAEYTGAKRAIAVVNGTAALHISFLLLGVQNGDEVLIPGLTSWLLPMPFPIVGQVHILLILRKIPWVWIP